MSTRPISSSPTARMKLSEWGVRHSRSNRYSVTGPPFRDRARESRCPACQQAGPAWAVSLGPRLAAAQDDPLVGRDLAQADGTAGDGLLGGIDDLGAEAELGAVRELRARVHVDDGGVHFVQEAHRRRVVFRDDGVGVAGTVAVDVLQ